MKKNWLLVVLGVLFVVSLAATQVLAGPEDDSLYRRTPDRTPAARATENAERRATQGRGNGQGQGNGNPQGERVNFRGIVVSADAASLTVTVEDGAAVTVALTAETRIRVPTLGGEATAASLQPGLQVQIQAVRGEDGALIARAVQVIPGQPVQTHRVGTVTDYQPGVSITIADAAGKTYTYRLSEETRILPAERADSLQAGARVTVIAPRDVTSTGWTAQGIVIHPDAGAPQP
ncbi:MAG: DUF5666 domain-containing protein [Anaerolineales bacterium]